VLGWVLEVWKAYAHRAATYQSQVLLTIVYFVILSPCAFFRAKLMDLSDGEASTWIQRTPAEKNLAALRRQF
jgi:hypothetical protein